MRRTIVLLAVAALMMLLIAPSALAATHNPNFSPNSLEPTHDQGGPTEGALTYGNCQSTFAQSQPPGESPSSAGEFASDANPSLGGPNNPSGGGLCVR
jgi:hypothetical protein